VELGVLLRPLDLAGKAGDAALKIWSALVQQLLPRSLVEQISYYEAWSLRGVNDDEEGGLKP
jgi:hypothetical protein